MKLRKWLARILVGLVLLVAVAFVAAAAWWTISGKAFLYGVILPDSETLLAGEEIPPLTAAALGRDLDYLATALPALHVDYERAFAAAEVERELSEVRAEAASMTADERALALFGVLALGRTGTGHTMVFPIQMPLDWRVYPLRTFWFDDGLFVTAAAARYGAAIGSRVTAIGGKPVAEALDLVAPYVAADNRSSLRGNLPLLLGLAEPLVALGLAAADGTLEVAFDEVDPLRVEPVALTSLAGIRWSRHVFAAVEGAWSPADPRPRRRSYKLDYRPDSRTLVLTLNALENQGDETLAALAERLDADARTRDIERFVLDLRSNSGGNNELGEPLVRAISGHPVLDRQGSFFVLIGRRTFSAAANLACALERRTRAVFVGETSGFAPNHYGDAASFLLPGSKILVRLASRHWREDLPGVERRALEPHLPVAFVAADHFAGRDAAMAAIDDYRPASSGLTASAAAEGLVGSYLLSPHHRVRVFEDGGRRRLAIDAAGPYVLTDLHSTAAGRHPTGVRGLALETREDGALELAWRQSRWPLEPIADGRRLPLELLRDGDVDGGVAAFRAAVGEWEASSHFERAINRLGYQALADGRVEDAVLMFTLNSELFSGSANTWDSLGDGLRAAGRVDDARHAYRRALEQNPAFDASRRSLERLGDRGPS